ncbi:MAG TPA: MFS transporter [Gaiellaceae bacterium]|nr:MFS transporter [Gaiellaceae bacterium]
MDYSEPLPDAAPARSGLRALHALRSRDFRLLWIGQTLSLIGNGAFVVALGWKTVQLTGSSSSLAVVLMANAIAMLATLLVGGALADRYPRRTLMILSDLARFALVGTLVVCDATGTLSFGLLIAFAAAVGLADGFFHPAFGGIVPLVVEQPLLASANTLIGLSRQVGFVVGPALAGVVYGLAGSAPVFAIDAATYVVAAAFLWLARPRRVDTEAGEGTVREIAAGLRYVGSEPWLWISIAVAAFAVMVTMAPFQSLLPELVQEEFGRGVGSYGTLFTLQSLGMAAGTLLFGQLNPRRHRIVLMYALFALNDLCVVVLALGGQYETAAAMVLARGACIGFGIGIWNTLLMELVPEGKLSRVVSVDFFGSFGLLPVGFALSALAAGSASAAALIAGGAALAFVVWTVPLAWSRVRTAA